MSKKKELVIGADWEGHVILEFDGTTKIFSEGMPAGSLIRLIASKLSIPYPRMLEDNRIIRFSVKPTGERRATLVKK